MAAAGGLGFGVAVGMLRELMNGSFYTSEQVESALQTRLHLDRAVSEERKGSN